MMIPLQQAGETKPALVLGVEGERRYLSHELQLHDVPFGTIHAASIH